MSARLGLLRVALSAALFSGMLGCRASSQGAEGNVVSPAMNRQVVSEEPPSVTYEDEAKAGVTPPDGGIPFDAAPQPIEVREGQPEREAPAKKTTKKKKSKRKTAPPFSLPRRP